jgi:hypothetical protein
MPRIRCHYIDCVFNEDGLCAAAAVEFDPDAGCQTFISSTDSPDKDDDVDEEDELEEWEVEEGEDDDEDLWAEDEEEDI